MFETNSRYARIAVAGYVTPSGETVAYVRRRFLPEGSTLPTLTEVTIVENDRLDRITARTLGDPEAFWRVADANNSMNPEDLTAEPGRIIRIPIPTA
jgi:hypothetical protein